MKIFYWCMLGLLSPATVWATTITAYSHLEEHIQILHKTDYNEATSGQVQSHVASDPLPEHFLRGNTSAQANANGPLWVSASGITDMYDGASTFFSSTASWSGQFFNDSPEKHYRFNFDISDINIGSDYRGLSSNRTGYGIDVFLNGALIYNQSYIFDTTSLHDEYIVALEAGDPDPPPGETYFTIAGTTGQLDLGYFDVNEIFTLRYQISTFAQPIDDSACYTNFGMSGNLVSEVTPVPEPASLLLFGAGLSSLVGSRIRFRHKR